MIDIWAFLIWSSDDFVALWLVDILLHLLLRRGEDGNVWTTLIENALIAIAFTGIDWAYPSLEFPTLWMGLALGFTLKLSVSTISLLVWRTFLAEWPAPWSRISAGIMFRSVGALVALAFLNNVGLVSAFFVFPFIVVTVIDIVLWLSYRVAWRGSPLAIPIESTLIVSSLLCVIAASGGHGPEREAVLVLTFIVKAIVTSLSLWLQAEASVARADLTNRTALAFTILRAFGCTLGAWVVLY